MWKTKDLSFKPFCGQEGCKCNVHSLSGTPDEDDQDLDHRLQRNPKVQDKPRTAGPGKLTSLSSPILLPSLRSFTDANLIEILTGRLLHLASNNEFEEFRTFYRIFSRTLGSGGLDHDKYAKLTYEYLRSFFGLFEASDDVRRRVLLYLLQSFKVFEDAVFSFLRIWRIKHYPDMRDYFVLHCCGLMLPAVKYQSCFYWCLYVGHKEFPENPHGFSKELFGKAIHMTIRRRKSDDQFQYSLFMGLKKSLPPVSPVDLKSNLEAHKKKLSSTPMSIPDERVERLERYLHQLPFTPYQRKAVPRDYAFTASFSRSRSQGGSAVELACLLRNQGLLPERILGTMSVFAFEHPHDKGGPCRFVHRYELYSPEEVFSAWYIYAKHQELGLAYTKPHGIFEPMKVRIITKGDCMSRAFLSYCKDLLRFPLTKLSCFRPTHLEFNDEWVQELEVNNKTDSWVSGDYSSATDLANMDISKMICKFILDRSQVPTWLRDICLRSLADNIVSYDENSLNLQSYGMFEGLTPKKWSVEYRQTNGQLMGSIISFPILCLMNLFCYWESVENYISKKINFPTIKLSLRGLNKYFPSLINGDDILFKSDSALYQYWRDVLPSYGFVPSKGKNLYTDGYCTINSRLYKKKFSKIENLDKMTKIEYFNHGLINGIRKGNTCDGYTGLTLGDWTEPEHWFRLRAYFDTPKEIRSEWTDREFFWFNRKNPVNLCQYQINCICKGLILDTESFDPFRFRPVRTKVLTIRDLHKAFIRGKNLFENRFVSPITECLIKY